MKNAIQAVLAASVLSTLACGPSGPAMSRSAASSRASSLGSVDGHYVQRNLVSDGFVPAEHLDANLVNGWGITALPTSPWWVSDNGTGKATLYDGNGVPQALVVSVTGAGGAPAAPTGNVANTLPAFSVTIGTATANARFMFASEDGTLSAWILPGTVSAVVVDHSAAGAVYKGLALASPSAGPRLLAANFHAGAVEVFDGAFAPVPSPGAFVDPGIPSGFAPFGIRTLGDVVYVTYAEQDAALHDDVSGKHLGFVSAFAQDGTFLRRIASGGKLNSPWGLALAPASFGPASGRLLVGNFGDGHLVSYALDGSEAEADDGGVYLTGKGGRITIDGLWGIAFGNDARAGPSSALFFAAGPGGEAHGLFGRIDFVPGTE
jgi:uncharacterized protein (TIGR03118 family)